jgi:hypothetical protein
MGKKPNAAELLAALQGPSAEDDNTPLARVTPQLKAVPSAQQQSSQEAQKGVQEKSAAETESDRPHVRNVTLRDTLKAAKAPSRGRAKTPRSELKHIGGYLDDETVEKVALLRIRLKLENSDLLKLAIEDLYRKHTARRAFGDA